MRDPDIFRQIKDKTMHKILSLICLSLARLLLDIKQILSE